jgi:hypothetical protein
MVSAGSFTATSTFNPDHPSALALYCSDGRYTQPVEELLRHLGHDRLDTLTLPGGPGLLSLTSAGFVELDATKRGAGFLIVGHKIRDVFLIAHQGCGYYRARLAGKDGQMVARIQREDLRAAAGALETTCTTPASTRAMWPSTPSRVHPSGSEHGESTDHDPVLALLRKGALGARSRRRRV